MLAFKTLRGAGWSVAARFSGRAIDLATLLILARVLSPADFGLTAIAASLIAIVDMVLEIPLVQALMRLPHVEKAHLDTAFTLGLLRGVVIALLLVAAAWPVARIYSDARLVPIMLVFSAAPIARSLYSPGMVHLYRNIDFRVAFIADFSGKVGAALICIGSLYAGAGYWALVINPAASAVLPTVLSYGLAPYRPRLSLEKVSAFSAFTGWFTSSQILAAFSWQYDRVFLGYHVDKAVLGRYGVASDFSVLPTQSLIGPAMRPVMAAFASIADDRLRLQSAFLRAARLTMIIAFPAGVGIALTADQIVSVVLGAQWEGAAPYLRWLSLAIMFTAYYQPVSTLCLAMDEPDVMLKINVLESIFKISTMTLGFYVGGVMMMIYARVAAAVFHFLISAIYARRLVGVGVARQVRNLWQVGLSCLVMVVAVLALRAILSRIDIGLVGLLLAMIASGVAAYGVSMHLLGFRLRTLRP
ncbi:lipopolysaccharide biosynthesis protein [Methylobacterium sp. NMS14P]|uniref:lipopolysaccharide biosynthesis protein n=1 Tax=Methylobacterium sp. NMS14P TaxID=2894310 RepID=UPI00235814AA|nr:lipopolysaccharide biosynthesis protein [Methylobacterium sp. NMS14P]WCS24355.1 lipopolysaccharide biosynthesis protein [Methylobacterium sp. NMS14P]